MVLMALWENLRDSWEGLRNPRGDMGGLEKPVGLSRSSVGPELSTGLKREREGERVGTEDYGSVNYLFRWS